MKIAYISADKGVPVFGQKGCSIHVQEMIRAFLTQGAEVELFTSNLGGEPPADLKDLPYHLIPNPKAKRAEESFEHALMQNNGTLQRILYESGGFDLVYERYSLFSFGAITHAKSMGIPGVVEVNAPLVEEETSLSGLDERESAELVAKKVFNDAHSIFSISSEVSQYVQSFMKSGATTTLHVVPNGVNPNRFPLHLKPSFPALAGIFTVGFVGALKPCNGLPILAKALSLLSVDKERTRLLIVGDGPQKEEIKKDLEKYNLRGITQFTGSVAHEEVPGLLASMDVAVAPYPPTNNFYFSPLKVYEYMAAGLPVIASATGQLRELIQNGWNGTLLEPGNAWELAKTIEELRFNPELRWFMGKVARKTVLKNHTWSSVARKVLSVAFKGRAIEKNRWEGGNSALPFAS